MSDDKRKKKTIADMSPGWWADHLPSPQPVDPPVPDTPILPPTHEEIADALKELGDINCVGIMVGDLLKAIECLQACPESTERQQQTLRRLRPLVAAANFYMRKAGMIAYDAGIRPVTDDDQQTS